VKRRISGASMHPPPRGRFGVFTTSSISQSTANGRSRAGDRDDDHLPHVRAFSRSNATAHLHRSGWRDAPRVTRPSRAPIHPRDAAAGGPRRRRARRVQLHEPAALRRADRRCARLAAPRAEERDRGGIASRRQGADRADARHGAGRPQMVQSINALRWRNVDQAKGAAARKLGADFFSARRETAARRDSRQINCLGVELASSSSSAATIAVRATNDLSSSALLSPRRWIDRRGGSDRGSVRLFQRLASSAARVTSTATDGRCLAQLGDKLGRRRCKCGAPQTAQDCIWV